MVLNLRRRRRPRAPGSVDCDRTQAGGDGGGSPRVTARAARWQLPRSCPSRFCVSRSPAPKLAQPSRPLQGRELQAEPRLLHFVSMTKEWLSTMVGGGPPWIRSAPALNHAASPQESCDRVVDERWAFELRDVPAVELEVPCAGQRSADVAGERDRDEVVVAAPDEQARRLQAGEPRPEAVRAVRLVEVDVAGGRVAAGTSAGTRRRPRRSSPPRRRDTRGDGSSRRRSRSPRRPRTAGCVVTPEESPRRRRDPVARPWRESAAAAWP